MHVDSYPQQMEMAGPSSNSSSRMMKRKAWGGLRQRWKLLGVFEIDQQHEFYLLTCMMKEGLAAAVQNTIDNPISVSNKYKPQKLNFHISVKNDKYIFTWIL